VKRAHVVVHGAVQGVFFRVEARDRARSLGVAGWVRNTADGSVEAVFEGDPAAVGALVAWCHEGPSWARVERVEVQDEIPEDLRDFRVR